MNVSFEIDCKCGAYLKGSAERQWGDKSDYFKIKSFIFTLNFILVKMNA